MKTLVPTSLLLLGLLGIGNVAVTAQENTAKRITAQLEARSKVQGHFIQTKTLEGMTNGLQSEGEFTFWRDHGIYWATQRPVKQAITYRSDKTLKWQAGESEPEEMHRRKDKEFRKILMAIFSFDTEQLALQFDQQWQTENDSWQLQLSPNSRTAGRFLDHIVLWGTAGIEGLRITNRNGESLTIEFSDEQQLEHIDKSVCISHFGYTAVQCDQFAIDAAP
jgi:outer membrane lipoprotein-sorting protein